MSDGIYELPIAEGPAHWSRFGAAGIYAGRHRDRSGRFAELIANAVAFRSRRSNRAGW
jgi:hypothetical protein